MGMVTVLNSSTIHVPDLSIGGYAGIASSYTTTPNGNRNYIFTPVNYAVVYDPLVAANGGNVTNFYTVGKSYTWSSSGITAGSGAVYTATLAPWQLHSITLNTVFSVCGLSRQFTSTEMICFTAPPQSTNFGYTYNGGSSYSTNGGSMYNPPSGLPSPKQGADDGPSADPITITPINGELARITFADGLEGNVAIVMTDLLGRALINDQMWMGNRRRYDIQLSSMSIPSGIYFVRVDGVGITKIQKVWKK
jgi:hypothetical protein